MRRKHRVIVEVTFDKRVTAKHATDVVREAVIRGELEERGVIAHKTKEAERVLQAEIRWRGKAQTKP